MCKYHCIFHIMSYHHIDYHCSMPHAQEIWKSFCGYLYTNTTVLSQQLRLVQWHLSSLSNVRAPPVPGASPPTTPLSPSRPPPFFQWSWKPGMVLKFHGTWFARTQRICCINNTGCWSEFRMFRCQTDGSWSEFSSTWMEFSTWRFWAWIAWIMPFSTGKK